MTDERLSLQRGPTSMPSDFGDEKGSIDGSLEHVNGSIKQFDVAISVAARHANDLEMSKLEDLRLRRKLDLHLLPLLFSVFCSSSTPSHC